MNKTEQIKNKYWNVTHSLINRKIVTNKQEKLAKTVSEQEEDEGKTKTDSFAYWINSEWKGRNLLNNIYKYIIFFRLLCIIFSKIDYSIV